MAAAQFWNAPEIQEIAEELIPNYHSHLQDCKVKIEYRFTDKVTKKGDKEVWGTCRRISGLNAHLSNSENDSEPFFVITVPIDVWNVLPLNKRYALVDHELCHAWAEFQQNEDDDGSESLIKTSIKPHDLEEFACIVRRHGLWREDIEAFVEEAIKKKEESDDK